MGAKNTSCSTLHHHCPNHRYMNTITNTNTSSNTNRNTKRIKVIYSWEQKTHLPHSSAVPQSRPLPFTEYRKNQVPQSSVNKKIQKTLKNLYQLLSSKWQKHTTQIFLMLPKMYLMSHVKIDHLFCSFSYFLFGESLHAVCRDERWVSVSSLCCGLDHRQRTMEQLRPCLGLGFGAGWEEGLLLYVNLYFVAYLLVILLLL